VGFFEFYREFAPFLDGNDKQKLLSDERLRR
jgi:hypothetical protein